MALIFCYLLKPRANGRNFDAKNSQHCWMLHVESICIPCCMMLDVVACCCAKFKPVKLFSQQLPTFLAQQCWELLRPSVRSLSQGRNMKISFSVFVVDSRYLV